jgi:hypothetical protein
MRTVHQATSVVAALALAFGATACSGTDSKPGALPTTTTSGTANLSPVPTSTVTPTKAPTSTVTPTKAPTGHGYKETALDKSLSEDIHNMDWEQQAYIKGHEPTEGVAVAATTPGGTASINNVGDFQASPGNVIAVKVGPAGKGFCISVYNKAATKATSATQSMIFKSDDGGAQAALGAC